VLYPANFTERFGADCPAIELREYTYAAAAAAAAPSVNESLSFLAEIPPRVGRILSAAELRARAEEIRTVADAMHHDRTKQLATNDRLAERADARSH